MARILVVFGTTDGHTAKIAEAIGKTLRRERITAVVNDAGRTTHVAGDFDGVVVAASVHAGGYQQAVVDWVRLHHEALNGRPTAFISVCLGVLQRNATVDQDLQAIVESFTGTTGWHPTITKMVAGALLYTQYGWIKRNAMKWIAARAGGDTDTSRDYVYTDWADLDAFATQFARTVDARPLVRSVGRLPGLIA